MEPFRRGSVVVGVTCLLFAIPCLLVESLLIYATLQSRVMLPAHADGIVTTIDKGPVCPVTGVRYGGQSYFLVPTITFDTPDGTPHSFVGTPVCAAETLAWSMGQQIAVRYDPKNPARAQVATFEFDWYGIGGFGAITIFLGLFGYIQLYLVYKRRRMNRPSRR